MRHRLLQCYETRNIRSPGFQTRWSRDVCWMAGAKIGSPDKYKSLLQETLVLWSTAKREHKYGTGPVSSPGECSPRILDKGVNLEACLIGWGFGISKWTSFKFNSGYNQLPLSCALGQVSSLNSQIATVLWILGCEFCWFSKLDVFAAHLSNACLKSWGSWHGV